MSIKARLHKFRNQCRLQTIRKYQRTIREQLTNTRSQPHPHAMMEIQNIALDSSNTSSTLKSFANLLYCQKNNKSMSDLQYLVCSTDQIKSLAKRFQTQIDNKEFNGESIEQFCKLAYFVCYCVESGRSRFQKLKCFQIMYSILPNMLEEIIQLCANMVIPVNTSILELISLVNLLIGTLSVKFQRKENDEIDLQFLSFLVLQKMYFMKETRLLNNKQSVNNTFYLLDRGIDTVFVDENGAKQTILNNTLKTMDLVSNEQLLWQDHRFKQNFPVFVERSFELLQQQIVSQIWNQNFVLLLKLVYEKSTLLFSSNFQASKRMLFELILKAIQLEDILTQKNSQYSSYFVLKIMFQYSYHTNIVEPRWVRYCKKVIERGFYQQRAGFQQCMALIILYEVDEGKQELQLLQRQMQQRQFVKLYQHLTYHNSQQQISKWQIASTIFTKLVRLS